MKEHSAVPFARTPVYIRIRPLVGQARSLRGDERDHRQESLLVAQGECDESGTALSPENQGALEDRALLILPQVPRELLPRFELGGNRVMDDSAVLGDERQLR